MARKVNITIGLSETVLHAVEKARAKLYENALQQRIPGVKYSRAMTIEMLLVEALRAQGIDVVQSAGGAL